MELPLLDRDVKKASQSELRVRPDRRAELAQDGVLCRSPQGPRRAERPSPLRREPHGLDPRVGMAHTFDETIALEQVETPGQGGLVEGQHGLELSQVRL